MAVETIFSSALGQLVLVFLLVFTVVFAVLQKTKILGDGKKQVDALVGLAVGLLVTSVSYATDLISNLVPFLAVGLIIILVFLLLIGIFYKGEFDAQNWMKYTAMVLALIAVIIAVFYFSGNIGTVIDFFDNNTSFVTNGLIIIVIIAVVLAFVFGGKDSSGSGKN